MKPKKCEVELTEGQKTSKALMPYAEKLSKDLLVNLNKTVPMGIPTMRYARQWVLEETIKLLQAQV
jgi:hypothetical protein